MPKASDMFDESALFGTGSADKENVMVVENTNNKKKKPNKKRNEYDPDSKLLAQCQLTVRRLEKEKQSEEHIYPHTNADNVTRILKNERRKLLEDYNVVKQTSSSKWEMKYVEKIENLLIERDQVETNMAAEKQKQETLDAKIADMERRIKKARMEKAAQNKVKVPFQETGLSEQRAQKKQHVLEGRLHRESSKFNAILAKNNELRDSIQTLRLEKKKFVHKQASLQRECRVNRVNSRELMEAATAFYNQQKSDRQKLTDQIQMYNLFQEQATEEEKLLTLKVDKLNVLDDFMDNKLFDRGTLLQEKKDREKREVEKMDQARMQKLLSLETAWRKIINLTTYDHNREATQKLSKYSLAERIVSKFNVHEEANYEAYQLCNFQIEKSKKIIEEINEIKDKFTDLKTSSSMYSFEQRETIKQCADQSKDLDMDYDYARNLYDSAKKALKLINDKTKALFQELGISVDRLNLPLKVDGQDIELDEFKRYLALVEDQINMCLVNLVRDRCEISGGCEESVIEDCLLPGVGVLHPKFPFVDKIHNPQANLEDLRQRKRKNNNFLQNLLNSNDDIDAEILVPEELMSHEELAFRASNIIKRKIDAIAKQFES